MSENSDISQMWKDHKEYSQNKRADNRIKAQETLAEHGINFQVKNFGAHLIVTGKDGVYDFWPGTGLYMLRNTSKKERGIFNLISKHCNPRK